MDYEQLLKKLKKIRLQKSISLRSLGEKLGVSGQYLSMIERGESSFKGKRFFLNMQHFSGFAQRRNGGKKKSIKQLRIEYRLCLRGILKL